MSYPRHSSIAKPSKTGSTECIRCGGKGGHYQWPGYTCFRCGGAGTDPTARSWVYPASFTDEDIEAHQDKLERRREAARQRRHEDQLAKLQAQLDKNLEAFPVLGPILERLKVTDEITNPFVIDVLSKVKSFDLTPSQVSAVVNAIEADDIERERLAGVPPLQSSVGSIEVTGEVISIREQFTQWGSQLKMLIELPETQRLWGTVPASLNDIETGDRVAFTATVKVSEDDPIFGFFSRPRKGRILERQGDERRQ